VIDAMGDKGDCQREHQFRKRALPRICDTSNYAHRKGKCQS